MKRKISAIIMAAGRGTRLHPLTATLPKPLIKVVGKTPLEYNLNRLANRVDEIVIVVNYLKDEIMNFVGKKWMGTKVKYVYQKYPKGTGHALYVVRNVIRNNEIIVINGDDIYSEELISAALRKGRVIVGKKENFWKNYGVLKVKNKKYLEAIEEKPNRFVGNLINIGLYKLTSDVFNYFSFIHKSERGEYEITDLVTEYAKVNTVEVIGCKSGWKPIGYPWDTLSFAENELEGIKTEVKGVIEKRVVIKGKLQLGRNSVIKSGAYLEGNFFIGDNCEIGPNCYIKGFGSIDNGSKIGSAVELTRSVVGRETNIKHLSYIGDSVIGNRVNIGAGTIATNLRHDGRNIMVKVNGKLVDTGQRKFGVVIGDGAKTGSHTTLYPGTKLEAKDFTLPGEVVKYERKPAP